MFLSLLFLHTHHHSHPPTKRKYNHPGHSPLLTCANTNTSHLSTCGRYGCAPPLRTPSHLHKHHFPPPPRAPHCAYASLVPDFSCPITANEHQFAQPRARRFRARVRVPCARGLLAFLRLCVALSDPFPGSRSRSPVCLPRGVYARSRASVRTRTRYARARVPTSDPAQPLTGRSNSVRFTALGQGKQKSVHS